MGARLTESVLVRLSIEALVSFLGQAERFEAAVRPGYCLALSNEPAADLNVIVAGRGSSPHFADGASACIARGQPFLAVLFPEAGADLERVAAEVGLVRAGDFQIMVREDIPIEPTGNPDVVVQRASGIDGAKANAIVASSAFGLSEEVTMRAMPARLTESPNLDIYLATIDGSPVGAVTITYQGDVAGIWAMGTVKERQREGVGRRLLSSAMSNARRGGTRRFFLGATPAGYGLYEGLGYQTQFAATVWAFGESGQT